MFLTMTSLILDSGVVPPGSASFPYFVAVQNGFTSALCTCLLINGFVGFQIYEDGTKQSVGLIRGVSAVMFVISGAVSILTFKNKAGLGPTNTVGLFVVLYILNGICLLVYVIMQVLLVTNTLQDRWPLGHTAAGVLFFVTGQAILYVLGQSVCEGVQHYLDGLFFATICNLLAVMMVYKVRSSASKSYMEAKFADFYSTGIRSPRRILNLASVQSRGTGRSKNCFMKRIEGGPSTTMADQSMQVVCISRPRPGHRITEDIINRSGM